MSPEIEILQSRDDYIQFLLSNTTPSFANAIRRTIISEVPTMAIEEVEFHLGAIRDENGKEYESVSPLFDEVIAHRLGLVPIPCEPGLFTPRDECVCDGTGCPNCTIMYSLNQKGPNSDDMRVSSTVYSDDLHVVKQAVGNISGEKYAKIFEIRHHIPIVKLNGKQAMLLYAKAELGTGTKHTKWQAAQAASYRYYPEITLDHKACDQGASCVRDCPSDVLELKGGKIVVKDLLKCTLCNACVDICELDAIKICSHDDKIIFQFETTGAMSPRDVLVEALRILKETLDEFQTTIKGLDFEEEEESADYIKPLPLEELEAEVALREAEALAEEEREEAEQAASEEGGNDEDNDGKDEDTDGKEPVDEPEK